jgi:hypothetical protein
MARAVEIEMQRIVEALPAGVARLSIPSSSPTNLTLILTPTNAAAAPIHVDVDDEAGVVTLTIGHAAVFEVPREGFRYSELEFLDEIRAICLAAIRGDVTETAVFKGDKVIGGSAKAKIGTVEVGDSWRQVFTNPFRRVRRASFSYQPYYDL